MNKSKWIVLACALSLMGGGLRAAALSLSMDQVEKAALEASSQLKAAMAEQKAADAQVEAARGGLLPRLSADGNYRYNAEVPSIKLNPNAPALSFGDHHNYSLGISAQWSGIDLGVWRQWQATQEVAEARKSEAEFQRGQVKLRARLAYLQTQLAAKRVRLFADAVNLAHNQSDDLRLRLKAGTSSRIDALSASNEELQRKAQFRLAQADLAGALRDLFALTGLGQGADASAPVDDATANSLPADIRAPSLVVALDASSFLLQRLGDAEKIDFRPADHARMRGMLALVWQARKMADAAFAGHYPRFQASARLSVDYPNGPVLESVNQTSYTVSGSLPLFSFGATQGLADAATAQAEAAAFRAKAQESDLRRDWLRSQDRLAALQEQRELNSLRAEQAQSLRDLVYKAYQVGGSSFLEVQSSSLKALEAGVDLAVTETQMLIEKALLAALAE